MVAITCYFLLDQSLDHGVTHAESGRGKFIGDGTIGKILTVASEETRC